MFGWLKYLLSGAEPAPKSRQRVAPRVVDTVVRRRDAQIKKLESAAAVEEARNKELEEQLVFKKREGEVLGRIQSARSQRKTLVTHLGEYGVRRPLSWRLVLMVGGPILLLVFLFSQC